MSQGNRFEMVIDSFGSYPDVQPLGYVQTKGKTNYAIQTLLNLKGHQLRMQRHILYGELEHPRPNKLTNVGTWGFPTLLLNTLQYMMYDRLEPIKREPVVLGVRSDPNDLIEHIRNLNCSYTRNAVSGPWTRATTDLNGRTQTKIQKTNYGKFSLEETNFREKIRELIIQSAHKNFNSTIFDKR